MPPPAAARIGTSPRLTRVGLITAAISAPPAASLRVAILVRSLVSTGGAEQQLARLAAGLKRRGWHVRVLSFYPGDGLEGELSAQGVPVVVLGKKHRWDVFGFLTRLRRELLRDPPDILQTTLAPPNVMAAVLSPWLKGIRIVWGIRASDMDLRRYDWTHSALARAEALLARRARRVIANSDAGRDVLLRRGFPAGGVVVIPNGIDADRFRPDPNSGRALRKKWLAGAAGPLIGLVARLDPMKDHLTFLRAARLYADRAPGARFVCIGRGPESDQLRIAADDLAIGDWVVWEEPRQDVAPAMNAFDVLTSSSITEAFPNVVAEAMACGLPVVATDVGDTAQIMGGTGYVVPRRDPQSLANGWGRAASLTMSERSDLGRHARARIQKLYSVDAMVDRTAATYREVIQARG